MDTRFHCVYLLTSLDPNCIGAFYIGYTVNPARRLRQHNGELVNGARQTKRRGRPWALVCCVSGFGEDRIALKFEWSWQNPTKAAALKAHVKLLSPLTRVRHAVGVLLLLLHVDVFARRPLKLHVFDWDRLETYKAEVEKIQRRISSPLLIWPERLEVERAASVESFEEQYIRHGGCQLSQNCGADGSGAAVEEELLVQRCAELFAQSDIDPTRVGFPPLRFRSYTQDEYVRLRVKERERLAHGLLPCSLCSLPLEQPYILRCPNAPFCALQVHIACLASWFYGDDAVLQPLLPQTPAINLDDLMNCGDGECAMALTHLRSIRHRQRENPQTESRRPAVSSQPVEPTLIRTDVPPSSSPVTVGAKRTMLMITNSVRPTSASSQTSEQASVAASTFSQLSQSSSSSPLLPHLLPAHDIPCPLCGATLNWYRLVQVLKRYVAQQAIEREVLRKQQCDTSLARRLARVDSISSQSRKRTRVPSAPPAPLSTVRTPNAVPPSTRGICNKNKEGSASPTLSVPTTTPRPIVTRITVDNAEVDTQTDPRMVESTKRSLTWTAFNEDEWLHL